MRVKNWNRTGQGYFFCYGCWNALTHKFISFYYRNLTYFDTQDVACRKLKYIFKFHNDTENQADIFLRQADSVEEEDLEEIKASWSGSYFSFLSFEAIFTCMQLCVLFWGCIKTSIRSRNICNSLSLSIPVLKPLCSPLSFSVSVREGMAHTWKRERENCLLRPGREKERSNIEKDTACSLRAWACVRACSRHTKCAVPHAHTHTHTRSPQCCCPERERERKK